MFSGGSGGVRQVQAMRIPILLATLAAIALPAAAQAKAPAGVWQNPKGTVHVQFRDCGPAICGRIIWASESAQAKTDAAGGGKLVGRDLFQQLAPTGRNSWAGSVLVPDIGTSIEGTITQTGPKTLVGEGCLFAGYGCKQQVWTRVK